MQDVIKQSARTVCRQYIERDITVGPHEWRTPRERYRPECLTPTVGGERERDGWMDGWMDGWIDG